MTKYFVFAVLFFTARNCFSQFFLTNHYYYLENDSVLWESPVTPKQVIQEKIKKIEIKEKKWDCRNRRGSDSRLTESYTCRNVTSTKVFIYDSIGFPVKIVWREDSATFKTTELKCVNTYNKERQLIKVELYFEEKLLSVYLRIYNESNQLLSSQFYDSDSRLVRKRLYRYDNKGYIKQLDDYKLDKDSLKLRDSIKYQYRENNKLSQTTDGSTIFLFDLAGLDSGFYQNPNIPHPSHATRVNLGKSITGIIVTRICLTMHHSKMCTSLSDVREIKEGRVYLWHFEYNDRNKRKIKQFTGSCNVSDLKTGLPLYSLKSYEWPMKQPRYSHKFIRFKRINLPPSKKYHFEFPSQPNRVEYFYKTNGL